MKMKQFFINNKGVVLIEFALILPILFLLTFPMIDYARYILLQQKAIKTAYVLGDAITMSNPIEVNTNATDIAQDATLLRQELFNNPGGSDLMDNVPQLFLPFRESTDSNNPDFNKWQVIVSYIYKETATSAPELKWQFNEDDNAFQGHAKSRIGNVSGFGNSATPNLPTVLANSMEEEEGVIIVEVFANHTPITPVMSALGIPFISATEVDYTAFLRARYGNLEYMWDNNCPPTSTSCP